MSVSCDSDGGRGASDGRGKEWFRGRRIEAQDTGHSTEGTGGTL